jgi:hypothetical protein
MTEKGDLITQPGQKEKMKIFSTHGFWTRLFSFGQNSHDNSSQRGKVTIWVARSGHGLISPIFFNETVNSE